MAYGLYVVTTYGRHTYQNMAYGLYVALRTDVFTYQNYLSVAPGDSINGLSGPFWV